MPHPQYTEKRFNEAVVNAQETLHDEYESHIKSDGVEISCR